MNEACGAVHAIMYVPVPWLRGRPQCLWLQLLGEPELWERVADTLAACIETRRVADLQACSVQRALDMTGQLLARPDVADKGAQLGLLCGRTISRLVALLLQRLESPQSSECAPLSADLSRLCREDEALLSIDVGVINSCLGRLHRDDVAIGAATALMKGIAHSGSISCLVRSHSGLAVATGGWADRIRPACLRLLRTVGPERMAATVRHSFLLKSRRTDSAAWQAVCVQYIKRARRVRRCKF